MRKLVLIFIILGLCSIGEAKTPWTSKPPMGSQIDWGHPLSRGLVGCWLMNEGGGNVVKDSALKNNGTNSGAIWKSSIKGQSLLFAGSTSTNNINCGSNSSITNLHAGPMTVSFWFNHTGYDTTSRKAMRKRWEITTVTNVTNRFYFIVDWSLSAGGQALWYITGVTTGVWHHGVVVYDGSSTSNNPIIYIDEKSQSVTETTAPSGVPVNDNDTNLCIGNRASDLARCFNGSIANVLIYNRILSPSEIQQLYREPYCFIKPQTDWGLLGKLLNSINRAFLID